MSPLIRRRILACATLLGFLFLVPSHFSAVEPVRALFDLDALETGPFPSDRFTVDDGSHITGRRVNLPPVDCSLSISNCEDLEVLNTLDGFNLQPRLSIPFDGPIDPRSVTSDSIFLIYLGDTVRSNDRLERVVGIDQVVWDPSTKTLHVESDELLDQHTRYALIVTRWVLDSSGSPVGAAEAFRRFRQTVRGDYKQALLEAIQAARRLDIDESDIVSASVFTTQSTTAVLERIRDQIKTANPDPADFLLAADGSRTVFPLPNVSGITFHQQTRVNGPLEPVSVDLSLLRIVSGAVGEIAFGKYRSPDYEVHPGEFIPPVSTRTGTPIAQGVNEIYFNLFLPSSPKPPGGWPVALHGTGANGSKQRDVSLVAKLAERGIATLIINAVGRGFGALGTLEVQTDGRSVTLPAGGRGIDQNGDGIIGSQEGQNATRPRFIIANRDAQRQTVVDYLQLVHVIENGMDVDGDGIPDLDPSRISYYGWSFGANCGTIFLALEPNVREGALYSLGGPIFENSRLSLSNRSAGFGAPLNTQIPSLINSPGINKLDGVPVPSGPFFNENFPLRDGVPLPITLTDGTNAIVQSPVINTVIGANAIQEYLEKRDWANQSGNQVAYARHLRMDPLVGIDPKSVLILFGKGDQTAPNPNATAMVRAGALADRVTFFRNDLAFAESQSVPRDPHSFVNNINHGVPLVADIARGAQSQIAVFLASGGRVIIPPEPTRFFEEIRGPLPEGLNFIP